MEEPTSFTASTMSLSMKPRLRAAYCRTSCVYSRGYEEMMQYSTVQFSCWGVDGAQRIQFGIAAAPAE